MKKIITTLLAALTMGCIVANAQINMPRPSPEAKVMQKVGMAEVTINYCRPQAKGRKIFGDVVPFDKMWRTGANSPTKITISDSISVNGKKIAGGEYALYTIPNATDWTVVFGKSTSTQAGDYKDEQEVVRFKVKPEMAPNMIEAFTINFVNVMPTAAEVELSWEKTLVKFKLQFDADAKVMADIKNKTELDANALFQAAGYYYDTDRDMTKALQWVTVATDKNPQFWTLHLKAKIQSKLKDYKGSIATAQKSIELAKAAKNDEYVKFNEKLIADATANMPAGATKKK